MTCRNWKIWGFLTVFATVILFFVSPDSYLHDMHSRVDAAWFFMGGKAWMNGLVPYVDFSDSKGPLLWLIYGIGYLLTPTSYIGVFWLTCLCYGGSYFLAFKTADFFLKDTRKALVCSLLLTFAFFAPWYHIENRAEDFCQFLMLLSLYRTCRLLYGQSVTDKELTWTSAILGGCFGASLLIKFNIAAMQSVFILWEIIYLIREKRNWGKAVAGGVAGFTAVTLPFIVCFLIEGNFPAFIREYFVNTAKTINYVEPGWNTLLLLEHVPADNPLLVYLAEWSSVLVKPVFATMFSLLILGGLLSLRMVGRHRWMPLTVSLFIFAISIRHHDDEHYLSICAFLFLFVIIGFCSLFQHRLLRNPLFAAIVVSGVIIPSQLLSNGFKHLFFNHNINQRDYYKVSWLMSQVDHPTLLNAYDCEHGFGTPEGVLPAGKYWTRQTGMTREMMQEHNELILSGKADFIILYNYFFDQETALSPEEIVRSGYKEYFVFGEFNQWTIFSKHDDLTVREDATPSLRRLFFK